MSMIVWLWLSLEQYYPALNLPNLIIISGDCIYPEDIALDKLHASRRGILTSHLKYFHRAIFPPGVQKIYYRAAL